jgi:radical SAM protein (TIGR04043 family)
MVPIYTGAERSSEYHAELTGDGTSAYLLHNRDRVGVVSFPPQPRFYDLATEDGTPYWKIAQLHSRDVLATTVRQTCIRYGDTATACQFCAIGESLRDGRTIAEKTPAQLAEVAAAARRLDGVRHVVMTTGTPPTPDRGAAILCEAAAAVSASAGIPIQAQCEPPDEFGWFARLRAAGVDALGMHLEAFDPAVRTRIMPGKAEVPTSYYFEAYAAAVRVFGRGQVSTYILAGLGDSLDTLLAGCRRLVDAGVYPFVVPFVPLAGTPLEGHPPPSAAFMTSVLQPLGRMLTEAGMTSETLKAGCGKCGACSPLSTFEH